MLPLRRDALKGDNLRTYRQKINPASGARWLRLYPNPPRISGAARSADEQPSRLFLAAWTGDEESLRPYNGVSVAESLQPCKDCARWSTPPRVTLSLLC